MNVCVFYLLIFGCSILVLKSYGRKLHHGNSFVDYEFKSSNDSPKLEKMKGSIYPKVKNFQTKSKHLFRINTAVPQRVQSNVIYDEKDIHSQTNAVEDQTENNVVSTEIGKHLVKITSVQSKKLDTKQGQENSQDLKLNPKFRHIIEIIPINENLKENSEAAEQFGNNIDTEATKTQNIAGSNVKSVERDGADDLTITSKLQSNNLELKQLESGGFEISEVPKYKHTIEIPSRKKNYIKSEYKSNESTKTENADSDEFLKMKNMVDANELHSSEKFDINEESSNGESEFDDDELTNGESEFDDDESANGESESDDDESANGESESDDDESANGESESDDDESANGESESDDDESANGESESDDDESANGESESDDDESANGESESDDDESANGESESDDDESANGESESDDDESANGESESDDDESANGESESDDDESANGESESDDDESANGESESDDDESANGESESDDDESANGESESDDDESANGESESDDDESANGESESDDDESANGESESDDDESANGESESDDDDSANGESEFDDDESDNGESESDDSANGLNSLDTDESVNGENAFDANESIKRENELDITEMVTPEHVFDDDELPNTENDFELSGNQHLFDAEFEGSGEDSFRSEDDNSIVAGKSGRFVFSSQNGSAPNCTTPKGEAGQCKRIRECLLSDALSNFNVFLQQLCLIRGALVGVCCPNNPVIEISNEENVTVNATESEILQPPEGCGLNTKTRIVGGSISVPHEWTWMVALLRRNRFYCGGVIINNLYVLTAAHCVMGMNVKELSVRLGEYDFNTHNKHQEDISIAEIKRHAQFVTLTFQHDIALLKLKRSIQYSKFVGSICLPSQKARDYSDVNGTVVGWGTVSFGGAASPILRQVTIPIWKNEDCDRAYRLENINESFMCAGSPEKGEDACQGDSGGPLMSLNDKGRWEVIGIVSWGRRCGDPSYPGVYTRVTTYLDWIAQNAI